ncbi:hypothetical protein KFL_000780015 [Klebsormidium nitens]|uniref:Uncharacterized protein n=1 Tax=Klebsormidium nitens TaxID=105231 RepID=A0A1Y1HVW6_KLENI|nr:hypothetical protein KFL_000780015 [Klebsormidium nitens]|eukprot:GAQ81339.1 hypothetical protein KFL_000780015 [Klebsormidium nitens]
MLAVSRWWQRRAPTQTATSGSPGRRRLVAVIAYTWGVISVVVPLVDIATDILVLAEVWGAWPMYVVLACVLAPLAVAGLAVAEAWVVWGRPKVVHRVGFKWVWLAPPAGESALHSPGQSWRLWDVACTVMLWPLATAGVIVQDFLAVLDKLGLRLTLDGLVVSFEGYQDFRILLEVLLESFPQAIFQTVLYRLGSSRATNIYVDDRIFAQSIGASLVTILMQYWVTLWESLQGRKSSCQTPWWRSPGILPTGAAVSGRRTLWRSPSTRWARSLPSFSPPALQVSNSDPFGAPLLVRLFPLMVRSKGLRSWGIPSNYHGFVLNFKQ